MRVTAILTLAIAILASSPGAVRAQRVTTTAYPGDRVRLRIDSTPANAWRVGELAGVRPETLFVRPCAGCAIESYARRQVAAMQVSVGRSSHAGAGFAVGALAGAAAVGVSYLLCRRDPPSSEAPLGGCNGAVILLPPAVLGGAFVGGFVGSRIPGHREVWRRARV